MGSIWLHDLPDVLARSGYPVDRYQRWETTSRGSGGYDALHAVGVHHTASNTAPANDMNYMWRNSPNEPVGAVYLARDGRWTVGAAGATNTQGKGGPYTTSKGTTPLNAANRYWISIEAANAGTGEAWPVAQQDSYVKGCAALCEAYGFDPTRDVIAHFEWTNRKIDPFGPSKWAGHAKWDMPAFRADVAAQTTGDDDMVPFKGRVYDSRTPGGQGPLGDGEMRLVHLPTWVPPLSAGWFNLQLLGGQIADGQRGYARLYTAPAADSGTSEGPIDGDGKLTMTSCFSAIGTDRAFWLSVSHACHVIVDIQGYQS